MPSCEAFGAAMLINLARARAAAGMNQATAAALIAVTQSHYSKIERGEVQLSAPDALTLCQAFKLDLATLLVIA